MSSLAADIAIRMQAMLQTALGSGDWAGHSAPLNCPVTCQAIADQAEVRQLVNMLAAVLGQPGLRLSFASALAEVGASKVPCSSWPDCLEASPYHAGVWVSCPEGFELLVMGGILKMHNSVAIRCGVASSCTMHCDKQMWCSLQLQTCQECIM